MLGRGLESLIPNKEAAPQPVSPPARSGGKGETGEAVFQIELDKIKPNPHQPRKDFNESELDELAASIREHGVIQPLIVSKIERETPTGTQIEYQLIAGERRLLAAKKAGLERVPAIVRPAAADKDQLEVAIVENIQRADLNPIETARAYAKLQEQFGLTQREIAARIGKSRETVTNIMRLLNLPTYIQEAVGKKQISDSQARLLLAISNPAKQQGLFEEIIRNNLSVRELKLMVGKMKGAGAVSLTAGIPKQDPELVFYEEKLQEFLGTRVSLQPVGEGGKITINFFSKEDLKAIFEKIARDDEGEHPNPAPTPFKTDFS